MKNCSSCKLLGRWYLDGHLNQEAYKLKCANDWKLTEDVEEFPYEEEQGCCEEEE